MMSRLTVTEWEAEVRDHNQALDLLVRPATLHRPAPLMEVLEFGLTRRLDANATREVLDNVDSGLRAIMQGQRGKRWLREAIREMAEEFADEFAEDVACEAQAAYDEMQAKREMVAGGVE